MEKNVLITGGTGLVGTRLQKELTEAGYSVKVLTRKNLPDQPHWDPANGVIDLKGGKFGSVINLAGDNIGEGRWTAAKKTRIYDSRVVGTRLLCEHLVSSGVKPKVLVSASAIGYYGDRGDEECDECSEPADDFLAKVCKDWEVATAPALEAGIRVVNARIGVVLSPDGGAVKKMLLPFKLGLGGPVGDGKQYMSWIAIDDLVRGLRFVMERADFEGPVNMVSPNPVTNGIFSKTLAAHLHRPGFMPFPAFMAKLLLGEMGEALLLSSTRVVPGQLMQAGFEYNHPELKSAFEALI